MSKRNHITCIIYVPICSQDTAYEPMRYNNRDYEYNVDSY